MLPPDKESAEFDLTKPLGSGVIMTSDGWVMTGFTPAEGAKLVALTSDGRQYEVEKSVIDPWSGLRFVKIKSSNLPVRRFASAKDVRNGQSLLAVSYGGATRVAWVENRESGKSTVC
jgi:S1-C subfamily serine protease